MRSNSSASDSEGANCGSCLGTEGWLRSRKEKESRLGVGVGVLSSNRRSNDPGSTGLFSAIVLSMDLAGEKDIVVDSLSELETVSDLEQVDCS